MRWGLIAAALWLPIVGLLGLPAAVVDAVSIDGQAYARLWVWGLFGFAWVLLLIEALVLAGLRQSQEPDCDPRMAASTRRAFVVWTAVIAILLIGLVLLGTAVAVLIGHPGCRVTSMRGRQCVPDSRFFHGFTAALGVAVIAAAVMVSAAVWSSGNRESLPPS